MKYIFESDKRNDPGARLLARALLLVLFVLAVSLTAKGSTADGNLRWMISGMGILL